MGKISKFRMPTAQEFLRRKRIYNNRRDPVWNYLEREMREMEAKRIKPYNDKVGRWLSFLQNLRRHFHQQTKKNLKMLEKSVGPPWFTELSGVQRAVVRRMKESLIRDRHDRNPRFIAKDLAELGIEMRFPRSMLLSCVFKCEDDTGLFLWYLFQSYYRKSPSDILPKYDVNSRLMLTAIAFCDMEECIEELKKLTPIPQTRSQVQAKKKPKYFVPDVKYGQYLSKMYVPCYSNYPFEPPPEKPKCRGPKIILRKAESYVRIAKENEPECISKRLQRLILLEQSKHRTCNYKFWVPPMLPSKIDTKKRDLAIKQQMWVNSKLKQKTYLKNLPAFAHMPMQILGVSYMPGYAIYQISAFSYLPSPYIIHNGNMILSNGQFVTLISGYYKYPRNSHESCLDCECSEIWGTEVMGYLKHDDRMCKCDHYYDLKQDSVSVVEEYFHPPTKHAPMWFDRPKIFQFDPWPELIRKKVEKALGSEVTESAAAEASHVKPKILLRAYLSILSTTPLLIPHLPYAHCLHQLIEWVRMRIIGPRTPEQNKRMVSTSQRKWLNLDNIDWRERAYNIPFTKLELKKFNFTHRPMLQEIMDSLLHNFILRNQRKRVQQARLWWSTMDYYAYYPVESFLDVFFTYMPSKPKDLYVYNPYQSGKMRVQGHTCSLGYI